MRCEICKRGLFPQEIDNVETLKDKWGFKHKNCQSADDYWKELEEKVNREEKVIREGTN